MHKYCKMPGAGIPVTKVLFLPLEVRFHHFSLCLSPKVVRLDCLLCRTGYVFELSMASAHLGPSMTARILLCTSPPGSADQPCLEGTYVGLLLICACLMRHFNNMRRSTMSLLAGVEISACCCLDFRNIESWNGLG